MKNSLKLLFAFVLMISCFYMINNNEAVASQSELAKQNKELQYWMNQGSSENVAHIYRNIAKIYDGMANYDEAIKNYELANQYYIWAGHADWGVQFIERANEIRSDIRLYVETKVELGQPLTKYEPVSGTYIGLYAGGILDKDYGESDYYLNHGSKYGNEFGAYLTYAHWTSSGVQFIESHLKRLEGTNKALQIALEPSEGLDMVKDGEVIRAFARKVNEANKAGVPVFIRFAGEMNGDWTPWYEPTGQKYIEKFRLVHDIFAQEAPDAAIVWAPNFFPYDNIQKYYPGDDYVDWIGLSLYMDAFARNEVKLSQNPFEYLDLITKWYPTKPLMYAEGGISHHVFSLNRDFTEWAQLQLNYMLKYAPKMYPQLKAITYFNQDMTNLTQAHLNKNFNYDLAANQAVFNTFKNLVKDPYLVHEVKMTNNNTVKTQYKQISELHEGSGVHNAFVYAKLPEGKVAHYVAVFQNDIKIADSYAVPFEIKLNLAALNPNTPVRVVAYDSNWKEISSRILPVNYTKVKTLSNFVDISEAHWAFEKVNSAVEKNLINGYNGKFRPEDYIAVEEFTAILARLYGDNDKVNSVDGFQNNVIKYMKSLNFPYSNQTSNQLTRTQAAEIIAASQGFNYTGDDAIKYLLVNGFAQGRIPGQVSLANYYGAEKLTRAESVTFLENIKNVGVKTIQKRPGTASDPTAVRNQFSQKYN